MFELKGSGTMLAQTIKREVELSKELIEQGFQHYSRAGEFLAELKELIPESSFESWLSKNCNLSIKEAQRIINFFSGAEITVSAQRAEKVKSMEPEERKEQGVHD